MLSLLPAGTVGAAEIRSGEVFRLPAGEVIADDLYVSASEIYIDGTVEGDLLAIGGAIIVNGTVRGDLMAAGATIAVAGEIGETARVAGAAIDVTGTIGDDLVAAGGGETAFPASIQIGERRVQPGVRVHDGAAVAGDAILFAGTSTIAGTIEGDLQSASGAVILSAQVGGDAEISAETFTASDAARVAGTLRYSTPQEIAIPETAATTVEYQPPPSPEADQMQGRLLMDWILRTLLIVLGFAILGWLLLRLAPGLLVDSAAAIAAAPLASALSGLLAAIILILLPLASIVLIALIVIFWGPLPGLLTALFLLSALALLWVLSPLVTGLWLGRRIVTSRGAFAALFVGALIIALLGRVPYLGWIVYLLSYVLALGGLIRSYRAAKVPVVADEPVTVG